MVVDDNKQMRDMLRETLTPIPCSIIECSNGKEAVESYDASLPDWVLMDVMMEPMNGIAALAEIKKHHPEAKVIMVTNSVEEDVRITSFKAGATAFVRKEFLYQIPELIGKL